MRVHTITCPGAVETGMFRKIVPVDQWPVEKTLEPGDVAKVILGCVRGSVA